VSRSYEVFLRTTRPPEVNTGDFVFEQTGANIKFGVPFSETDTVFFGAGIERTKVTTYTGRQSEGFNDSPELYKRYVTDFGDGTVATTTSFPLTATWQRDNRDSALVPTVGRLQKAFFEVAPVGSLKYYRAVYQHQYYTPIFRAVTLALNGEIDYGRGLGGKPYPVFKNWYAGGIGSVRGYEGSSLGPRDSNGDPLGGTSRLIANAELQFPFPGSGNDRTLRWFTFFDAGNVFAEGARIQVSDLRYSAGAGISWVSPIGPLKLSYGVPLNSKSGDRKQSFQFQLGTGF
jgi:outer membrane protein insertion porin family